jgi:hypothetical protein
MAARRPLVLGADGKPKQLQAGDTLDGAVAGLVPFAVNARLSLVSGNPVGVATSAGTIYWEPYLGNRYPLYDGAEWVGYELTSALSVSVPSTLFRMFDVFVWDNSGTPVLETQDWTQASGAISGATNASPIVLTLSLGHGLVDGDLIGVAGVGGNTALNGQIWQCAATTATTTALFGSTGNGAYTAGGTWYKVNGQSNSGITTQNGIPVDSGDSGKLYLGNGMTDGVSGQCTVRPSPGKCWLSNLYNTIDYTLTFFDSSAHTYASTTNRPWNGNGNSQLSYMVPYAGPITEYGNCSPLVSGGGGSAFPIVGFGNQNINVANRYVAGTGGLTAERYGVVGFTDYSEGLSWSGIVEGNLAAGTGTYTQIVAQLRIRR